MKHKPRLRLVLASHDIVVPALAVSLALFIWITNERLGRIAVRQRYDSSTPTTVSELSEHQRLWVQHKIRDYKYTIQLFSTLMVVGAVIEVHKGKPSQIIVVDDAIDPKMFSDFSTVDKLFQRVRDSIDAKTHGKTSVVSAHYDETFGFPTYIRVVEEAKASDALYSVSIKHLKILKMTLSEKSNTKLAPL